MLIICPTDDNGQPPPKSAFYGLAMAEDLKPQADGALSQDASRIDVSPRR